MRLVWDESKRERNVRVHGFDFDEAYDFSWEAALIVPTYPGRGNRTRWRATGQLGDRLVTIIFSPLGSEAYSLISMRPAGRRERREYDVKKT
jgi:uncharacterized DUF497 family protein